VLNDNEVYQISLVGTKYIGSYNEFICSPIYIQYVLVYRILGNFRGTKFSRMSPIRE